MKGISKFDELRRKTDQELVYLLRRSLETGFAACASIELSADHGAVGAAYARAKRASLNGALLLHMLGETSAAERMRMETQLRCLERIVKRIGQDLFKTGEPQRSQPAMQVACAH